MREKGFIISLIFVSLSFSAFLFGFYLVKNETAGTRARLLSGFTPTPQAASSYEALAPKGRETRKISVVKRKDVNVIVIDNKEILETRLINPILEWKDRETLYLKTVKNNEAMTFILTLDGKLTQIK